MFKSISKFCTSLRVNCLIYFVNFIVFLLTLFHLLFLGLRLDFLGSRAHPLVFCLRELLPSVFLLPPHTHRLCSVSSRNVFSPLHPMFYKPALGYWRFLRHLFCSFLKAAISSFIGPRFNGNYNENYLF